MHAGSKLHLIISGTPWCAICLGVPWWAVCEGVLRHALVGGDALGCALVGDACGRALVVDALRHGPWRGMHLGTNLGGRCAWAHTSWSRCALEQHQAHYTTWPPSSAQGLHKCTEEARTSHGWRGMAAAHGSAAQSCQVRPCRCGYTLQGMAAQPRVTHTHTPRAYPLHSTHCQDTQDSGKEEFRVQEQGHHPVAWDSRGFAATSTPGLFECARARVGGRGGQWGGVRGRCAHAPQVGAEAHAPDQLLPQAQRERMPHALLLKVEGRVCPGRACVAQPGGHTAILQGRPEGFPGGGGGMGGPHLKHCLHYRCGARACARCGCA